MFLNKIISSYSLLLSLGAFYLGSLMLSGEGIFAAFPPEWEGVMPFGSWAVLALFGMIVFGLGNAAEALYGFLKKDGKVYVPAIILGALCFGGAMMPVVLLGEWYLPTVYLFLAGTLQMLFGAISFFTRHRRNARSRNHSTLAVKF